jgi:L-2-hydroxyglutarate oxidase LhgO
MDQIDALVVGAGVVGLAVARSLALRGHSVLVVERDGLYGGGVSSRNSEVIHAGHYYEPGSLKARWCVEGRRRLVAYCAERHIPHRLCGKLVVAVGAAELARLEALWQRGQANGVEGLSMLSAAQARALEPALQPAGAMFSACTGIVDSHALMTALLADAESAGAALALKSPFVRADRASPAAGCAWAVHTGGEEPFVLGARWLVNAAGLGAQAVARAIEGLDEACIPTQHLAKGNYFSLAGRSPFGRLIYPLPVDGGLGVHLTLDLGGQARFGPDVEWLPPGTTEAELDHRVDPARHAAFERDIRRWWPGLPDGALQPAYSGVRPKISGPGEPAADFCVSAPFAHLGAALPAAGGGHGLPGLINLFGIESPGLTSAMAVAEQVAQLLERAA